jgi:hypothetical protein
VDDTIVPGALFLLFVGGRGRGPFEPQMVAVAAAVRLLDVSDWP